jgi:hypothetical protein
MLVRSSGCGGVCCAMADENARGSVALQFESANPTQQGLPEKSSLSAFQSPSACGKQEIHQSSVRIRIQQDAVLFALVYFNCAGQYDQHQLGANPMRHCEFESVQTLSQSNAKGVLCAALHCTARSEEDGQTAEQ